MASEPQAVSDTGALALAYAREQISCCSDADLILAMAATDSVLTSILKVDIPDELVEIAKIESNLTKGVVSNFKKAGRTALKKGLKEFEAIAAANPTESQVKQFLSIIEKELTGVGKAQAPAIAAATKLIYQVTKGKLSNKLKLAATLTLQDTQTINVLAKDHLFWVGNSYNAALRKNLNNTVANEVIAKGLGKKEAGKKLRDIVEKKMGLVAPVNGGERAVDAYFAGLGRVIANRAQNFSRLATFQIAGFTRYRIIAIMDQRTSAICREMDGRVFTVDQGVQSMEAQLGAKNPSQVKSIAPWMSAADVRRLLKDAGQSPTAKVNEGSAKTLADAGVALPPYHGHCRTWIEEATEQETWLSDQTAVATPQPKPKPKPKGPVVSPAGSGPTSSLPPIETPETTPGEFPWKESELKLRDDLTSNLDGMHVKFVYEAPDGSRWLFKPTGAGEEFRAHGDVAAAKLAKLLGLKTPQVHTTRLKNRFGSIQKMWNTEGNFASTPASALTTQELALVQREHIFDWLISQHDTYSGNIIRHDGGQVAFIDKGQMFRFFGKDSLETSFNPNPVKSYYNTMIDDYAAGKHPAMKLFDVDSPELKSLFDQIENVVSKQFDEVIEIMNPYTMEALKAGQLSQPNAFIFQAKLESRWGSVRGDFINLYADAERSRKIAMGIPKSEPLKAVPSKAKLAPKDAITPVDKKFLDTVEDAGSAGKAFHVGDGDIENGELLTMKMGDRVMMTGKLRMQTLKRILDSPNIRRAGGSSVTETPFIAADVVDEIHTDMLMFIKSFNYHFDPKSEGFDSAFTFPARKRYKQLRSTLNRIKKDAEAEDQTGVFLWSRNLLGDLERRATLADDGALVADKRAIGVFWDAPPNPTVNLKRAPMPDVETELPTAFKVNRQDYKARGTKLKRRKGTDAELTGDLRKVGDQSVKYPSDNLSDIVFEFDSGVEIRIVTTKSEDPLNIARNNMTSNYAASRVGRIEVVAPSNTKASYKKVLDAMDEIGLDSQMMTAEEAELLYLRRVTWSAQEQNNKAVATAWAEDFDRSKIQDQIKTFKAFWSDRMGVDDVAALDDYSATPSTFRSDGLGHSKWFRFDISEADIPDDLVMFNDITGRSGIEDILKSGQRGFASNERRIQYGIDASGMSAPSDMESGGAEYVFTRIGRRADIEHKGVVVWDAKKILRDTEAISYNSDHYGNVLGNFVEQNKLNNSVEGILAALRGGTGNETIIKHTLDFELLEGFAGGRFARQTAAERAKIVELFSDVGLTQNVRGKSFTDIVAGE